MVMDGFPTTCPTAEKMVLWLAEKGLPRVIKRKGVQIEMVRLYETPTSYAEWRRQ
jgi:6-pyruvoyltetrahydropterin/6-carboxytetrahydropterin synthase